MKMPRRFLPKLSALALAIAAANANAATCTPTNVLYTQGSTINVPCVEIDNQVYQARFKLLSTAPEHIWELQTITPADADTGGTRANVTAQADGKPLVNIPLLQSTDGSLWHPQLEYIGQDAESGKYRFKIGNVALLDPSKDVSRLVFRVGGTNTAANRRANKVDVCRNGKTLNIAEPAVKASDTLGACGTTTTPVVDDGGTSQTPAAAAGISAAVLKIKRVEITGTGNGTMNLDISGDLDLVKVINGEPQLLGEIVLPADTHIGQVRLILDAGSYVIQNGEQYALTVPSGEQTGLKIIGDWTTVGGQMTQVQLDLGLEDIRFNKGQGEFRLKPVVKVVGVTSGELPVDDEGEVELPNEEAFLLAIEDRFSLEVPYNATSEPESLTVDEKIQQSRPSSVFNLGPSGTVFSTPSTVSIQYDPSKLASNELEENMTVIHNGIPIPSVVNTELNIVTAQIEHFSCVAAENIGDCSFSDVGYGDWFYDGITHLCKLGVVKGYKDGTYLPEGEATLFEALKILLNISNSKSCDRYQTEAEVIAAAEKQGLTIDSLKDENGDYKKVSREDTFNYMATLLGKTTSELKESGVSNLSSPNRNILRSEISAIGDRAWVCSKFDNCHFYQTEDAVEYATAYVDTAYGSNGNPFDDYSSLNANEEGGNCTNFASQSILSGLARTTDVNSVYNARTDFATDSEIPPEYKRWFYIDSDNRGDAWTGANNLYEYADSSYARTYQVYNGKYYRGIHFDFVTKDTPQQGLNVYDVRKGDIVFVDWDSDEEIDHSMVVTDIDTEINEYPFYRRILVTYQNAEGYDNQRNYTLHNVNNRTPAPIFHVYRPTFYGEQK